MAEVHGSNLTEQQALCLFNAAPIKINAIVDDFEKAKHKLKLAEETSDLQSEAEDPKLTLKKRQPKRPPRFDQFDTDDDEEDCIARPPAIKLPKKNIESRFTFTSYFHDIIKALYKGLYLLALTLPITCIYFCFHIATSNEPVKRQEIPDLTPSLESTSTLNLHCQSANESDKPKNVVKSGTQLLVYE